MKIWQFLMLLNQPWFVLMKSTKKNIMILSVVGFASLSILFSGCSRTATTGFEKDPIYAQNLQYTKVGKIIKDKIHLD